MAAAGTPKASREEGGSGADRTRNPTRLRAGPGVRPDSYKNAAPAARLYGEETCGREARDRRRYADALESANREAREGNRSGALGRIGARARDHGARRAAPWRLGVSLTFPPRCSPPSMYFWWASGCRMPAALLALELVGAILAVPLALVAAPRLTGRQRATAIVGPGPHARGGRRVAELVVVDRMHGSGSNTSCHNPYYQTLSLAGFAGEAT